VCGDGTQLRNDKKSTQKEFIFPRNLPPKDLIVVFISERIRKEVFSLLSNLLISDLPTVGK